MPTLYSMLRIRPNTFMIGSLSDPWLGSPLITGDVASLSSTMAATVASRSPYIPLPKSIDPDVKYDPVLNALEHSERYLGLGFEIPKRFMMRVHKKGATAWIRGTTRRILRNYSG